MAVVLTASAEATAIVIAIETETETVIATVKAASGTDSKTEAPVPDRAGETEETVSATDPATGPRVKIGIAEIAARAVEPLHPLPNRRSDRKSFR